MIPCFLSGLISYYHLSLSQLSRFCYKELLPQGLCTCCCWDTLLQISQWPVPSPPSNLSSEAFLNPHLK